MHRISIKMQGGSSGLNGWQTGAKTSFSISFEVQYISFDFLNSSIEFGAYRRAKLVQAAGFA